MTSEIKPEDVKLPAPAAWLVTGGRTFVDKSYTSEGSAAKSIADRKDGARLVPLVTADQVRAAVLEAKAQERERALREVAKVKEWLSDQEAPFGWAVEDQLDECAAAIRSGK